MRALNRFESIKQFNVNFEERWDIEVQFAKDRWTGFTNARALRFRPDFVLRHDATRDEDTIYQDLDKWEGIEWSTQIVFEIETNPRKIFKRDRLKLEYYDRVRKSEPIGRLAWAFVLVVMEDSCFLTIQLLLMRSGN